MFNFSKLARRQVGEDQKLMYMVGQAAGFYGYGGISDTFAGIFEAMADQEGLNGKRYRLADIRALLGDVAERRFASGIYELCHLLRGFGQLDRRGDAVNLFWSIDQATPSGFKSLLKSQAYSARLNEDIFIQDAMICLHYPDGKEFQVKSGRMPYLAALYDFALNAIGYVSLQECQQALLEENLSHKALSEISNDLFSRIYAFLGDHLPATQGQRKMRHILTFLTEKLGPDFQLADISDEDILSFWEDQDFSTIGENSSDFIRFATVFDDFTRFAQSIRETLAKRQVTQARRIGSDFEAGDVMPEDLGSETYAYDQEAENLLGDLQAPPLDEIKFIGKRDTEILLNTVGRVEEIRQWALSYLRSLCFGQGQSRITQALRNKVDAIQLQSLCDNCSKTSYADQIGLAEKLADNLQTTLQASLYVVHQAENRKENIQKVEINFEILGKLRKAFHNVNRQGFQEEILNQPEKASFFEQGADCLEKLGNRHGRILKAIQKVDPALFEQSETKRFAAQFHRIYGGHG